jgi:hypothetical protein
MSSEAQQGGPRQPNGPGGRITTVAHTRRGVEVALRLRNDEARPLYYIANVRTVRYDPVTKTVTVGLSDEGRVLIPGAAQVHPVFNYIDPGSEAELRIVLPPRVVKLADTGAPGTEVRFEEHSLADADRIVVEVAWSDVPLYEDMRAQSVAQERQQTPAEAWMKGKTVMTADMPKGGRDTQRP